MNFGSYIHKIFEEGYDAKHVKDLEKLAEQYKATYKVSAQYKAKTRACLDNFMKFNNLLGETLYNELHFKIDLGDDIIFEGYIDRIVKGKNGKVLVIDYKTSKREKTKFDLYNDTQMKGYAFAVHKELGIPISDIMIAHYYPVTNNFVHLQYSKTHVMNYMRELKNNAWKIRKAKKDDMKASMNDFCNWCNYKDLCPMFEPDENKRLKLISESKSRPTRKRT